MRPASAAAILLCTLPMVGEYIAPLIVGGLDGQMVGNLAANFFNVGQYQLGAALAVLVTVFLAAALVALRRFFNERLLQ